ncbi:hypothetical protein CANCADRAFT_1817 [Tortispora caseinolytica NRRL Y-17796]|uniref:Uncharacterized protein n=1 Tax=Tortispora caseinolytica NRRL Y-17796 TaxID=767744 RepID=A0A1E4TE96_9ASCO|nr:hypothetical protein CANCADRAFT_1817 [Tortispora caseinolytica NRRL Y-17796]
MSFPPMQIIADKTFGCTAENHSTFMVFNNLAIYAFGAGAVLLDVNTRESTFFSATDIENVNSISTLVPASPTAKSASVSPNSRDAKSLLRDRAKLATAVSTNGTLVAIGESGFQPRVLLFRVDQSNSKPVSFILAHSFGIKHLAFSPCGKYLATLGTANDGFIYVWDVSDPSNPAMFSTNRCISTVHDMAWFGSRIATVGLRHIRIWRTDTTVSSDIGSHLLTGRNVILGDFSDACFTQMATLDDQKFAVSTAKGEVILISNSDGLPLLTHIASAQSSSTIDAFCANSNGTLIVLSSRQSLSLVKLRDQKCEAVERLTDDTYQATSKCIAFAADDSKLIALESDRIALFAFSTLHSSISSDSETLTETHPISGIIPVNTNLYMWNAKGHIMVCNSSLTPLNSFVVPSVANASSAVVSDTLVIYIGTLDGTIVRYEEKETSTTIAHESEITSLAFACHESKRYIASSGRDRITQIFIDSDTHELNLTQSLDTHHGSVMKVAFTSDFRLISSSIDRSVAIHEFDSGKFRIRKIVNLKSSPIDFSVDSSKLLVSTLDKCFWRINTEDGEVEQHQKLTDENGESLSVDKISFSTITDPADNETRLSCIVGLASDKSIKTFSITTGQSLASAFGHTGGVTGLVKCPSENNEFYSSGVDGTLISWKLGPKLPESDVTVSSSPRRIFMNRGERTSRPTSPVRNFQPGTLPRSNPTSPKGRVRQKLHENVSPQRSPPRTPDRVPPIKPSNVLTPQPLNGSHNLHSSSPVSFSQASKRLCTELQMFRRYVEHQMISTLTSDSDTLANVRHELDITKSLLPGYSDSEMLTRLCDLVRKHDKENSL